jgi:hypothetical protein
MKKVAKNILIETRKSKMVSSITIGALNVFVLIYLNYLYGNQGYSTYLFLPIQIIFILGISYLAIKTINFLSIKYILAIIASLIFLIVVRGTGNNRTPLKDLDTLMNADKITYNDLVSVNSLKRSLAQRKFNIKNEYFYFLYSSYKPSKELETMIFSNDDKFWLSDTTNFILHEKCMYIKSDMNKKFCFSHLPYEIVFNTDSASIVVLKSSEISESLNVDKYLIW